MGTIENRDLRILKMFKIHKIRILHLRPRRSSSYLVLVEDCGSAHQRLLTRQRSHLKLRSLWNANRKFYFAIGLLLRLPKVLKIAFGTYYTDFGSP